MLAPVSARLLSNASSGSVTRCSAPSKQLRLGARGTSSAIEIAARAGLPESICQRARELSLETGGPFSKALAAVEEERRALAGQTERARVATAGARGGEGPWGAQRGPHPTGRVERE